MEQIRGTWWAGQRSARCFKALWKPWPPTSYYPAWVIFLPLWTNCSPFPHLTSNYLVHSTPRASPTHPALDLSTSARVTSCSKGFCPEWLAFFCFSVCCFIPVDALIALCAETIRSCPCLSKNNLAYLCHSFNSNQACTPKQVLHKPSNEQRWEVVAQ